MTQAPATPSLAELLAENAALTKALTGLTCGGSEFFIRKGDRYVADIDACVSWVRRVKEDAHRRTIKAITEQKAAQALADRYEKALREIAARSNDFKSLRTAEEALSSQGRHEGGEPRCDDCGKAFGTLIDGLCSACDFYRLEGQIEDRERGW